MEISDLLLIFSRSHKIFMFVCFKRSYFVIFHPLRFLAIKKRDQLEELDIFGIQQRLLNIIFLERKHCVHMLRNLSEILNSFFVSSGRMKYLPRNAINSRIYKTKTSQKL